MKSIIYSIAAIAILIIMAFSTGDNNAENQTILIQPSEKISSSLLMKSAEIITKRLNSFNAGKSEVKADETTGRIKITLTGDWDLPVVNRLIEQQGNIEFYLAYNQGDFKKMLNGDTKLFSMITPGQPDDGGSVIGCVQGSGIEKVNNYLKTLEAGRKCKFAWSQEMDGTKSCLYALRVSGEKGAIVKTEGIESSNYDGGRIKIKLNETASKAFAATTRENINEIMAIVLDDHVISAPKIRSEINFGEIEISGSFSKNEAGYMAAILNSGSLPCGFILVK